MPHPSSRTSTTKYQRPTPPLSVNSSSVSAAVSRDLVSRITMHHSSGANAAASIHSESANDCCSVEPLTVKMAAEEVGEEVVAEARAGRRGQVEPAVVSVRE